MVWTTVPAFSNSILTVDPTVPAFVQVIWGAEPLTQDSPPFGDLTVIVPAACVVPEVTVKYVLLVSCTVDWLVLWILTV
jgi:hypothetical protein